MIISCPCLPLKEVVDNLDDAGLQCMFLPKCLEKISGEIEDFRWCMLVYLAFFKSTFGSDTDTALAFHEYLLIKFVGCAF